MTLLNDQSYYDYMNRFLATTNKQKECAQTLKYASPLYTFVRYVCFEATFQMGPLCPQGTGREKGEEEC